MKSKIIAALVAGLALVGVASSAPVPSVMMNGLVNTVYLLDDSGDPFCSGFITQDHKVITAAHCVADGAHQKVLLADNTTVPMLVTKVGDYSSVDMAVMIPNDPDSIPMPGLALCKDPAEYGQDLYLLGAPLGEMDSVNKDYVSKPSVTLEDGEVLIQIAGGMLPGTSGGPAIDAKTGCVVGIANMIKLAQPVSQFEHAQPVGLEYITPITDYGMIESQPFWWDDVAA